MIYSSIDEAWNYNPIDNVSKKIKTGKFTNPVTQPVQDDLKNTLYTKDLYTEDFNSPVPFKQPVTKDNEEVQPPVTTKQLQRHRYAQPEHFRNLCNCRLWGLVSKDTVILVLSILLIITLYFLILSKFHDM
jgi:hypothetical protein